MSIKHLEINEALALTDRVAIQEQIQSRYLLIRDCVGWLYPSILSSEIVKLRELYERL